LDSVDPEFVQANRALGATGATSNPVIISGLIETGRFDRELAQLMRQNRDVEQTAWRITDDLVTRAEKVFAPVYASTKGNDGYVSFELDPLIDDLSSPLSPAERTARYIELGRHWAAGHTNRMIKVPATPAGIDALEELVASGVTVSWSSRIDSTAPPATPSGEGRSGGRAWRFSNRSTASLSAGSTCTPKSTCPNCLPPLKGRWAS
jgi:transaldolase